MPAIQVQQLTKTFVTREKQPGLRGSVRALFHPVRRETQAVQGITFSVEKGERLAFIGPNGERLTRFWRANCGNCDTYKRFLAGLAGDESGLVDPTEGRILFRVRSSDQGIELQGDLDRQPLLWAIQDIAEDFPDTVKTIA